MHDDDRPHDHDKGLAHDLKAMADRRGILQWMAGVGVIAMVGCGDEAETTTSGSTSGGGTMTMGGGSTSGGGTTTTGGGTTGLDDATQAILAILGRFFAEPVARALLLITRSREGLEGVPLADAALGRAVDALERALPAYLANPTRRQSCIDELRELMTERQSPPSIAPSERGPSSQRIYHVGDSGEHQSAAEVARAYCRNAGFSVLDQTKVSTAVAELTRNMIQYAGGGELWFSMLRAPRRLEVAAIDRGPGIPEVDLVMSTAYRSRTGMGMGLKGVKRIVDELEIQSSRAGTRIVFRKYA